MDLSKIIFPAPEPSYESIFFIEPEILLAVTSKNFTT